MSAGEKETPRGEGPFSGQLAMLNCQGLVRALAWKIYQKLPVSVDIEDLVAYGQLGLAEAAHHFEPERGYQFTTFAYYRVRGAILDGLSQLSWFDPADYHGSRYRGGDEDEEDDRYAPPQDREGQSRLVSLSNSGTDVEDRRAILPESQVAADEMCQRIRGLVMNMPGDEGKLLRATYFDGMAMTEAATCLGISKSWASRLHDRALKQLGQSMGVGAMAE